MGLSHLKKRDPDRGFTLIELSIVLVIIGLIVGGVLVGQDLIRAAYVRAQITQIEKYNTAVNTFYGKYQALPGDLNNTVAMTNGFAVRGSLPGQGDGNGIIEGNTNGGNCGIGITSGEEGMFWVDLTYANGLNLNLIPGSFNSVTPTFSGANNVTGTQIGLYSPAAAIGGGNYIYVTSGGTVGFCDYFTPNVPSYNAYVLIRPIELFTGSAYLAYPGMTVSQAYNIDRKIDDGMPQSGNVWANAYAGGTNWLFYDLLTSAGAASSTSCFDSTPPEYSMSINNGAGLNCALAFKMQGGD